MRTIARFTVVSLVLAAGPEPARGEDLDLDTRLMLATFKVANPASTGTGFILSRPARDCPGKTQSLLITADHVFRLMKGDEASIVFRKRDPDGGFAKSPTTLKVREGGKDLWARHPAADVAAIEVSPPPNVSFPGISVELLATDDALARYEVHPGDLIKCIGYPHANLFESNDSGFAIERIGCLASYPLLPTKKTRTFLFDSNTFEGESGGPIFLSECHRVFGGKTHEGRTELILGLMSGQHFLDEEYRMVYQSGKFRHRMGLGIVVHATAIRETIDLIPQRP